jgi:hypothetical protein
MINEQDIEEPQLLAGVSLNETKMPEHRRLASQLDNAGEKFLDEDREFSFKKKLEESKK